jgi:hypothetical protein
LVEEKMLEKESKGDLKRKNSDDGPESKKMKTKTQSVEVAKGGAWTKEETQKLEDAIKKFSVEKKTKDWYAIAKEAGTRWSDKQCQTRYQYLKKKQSKTDKDTIE